jgi:hypothetical protein
LAYAIITALIVVTGCATPGVLKKPPNAPAMTRQAEPNPMPAFATPDANAHD